MQRHPRNHWLRLCNVLSSIDSGNLSQAHIQFEAIAQSGQLGQPVLQLYARYLQHLQANASRYLPAIARPADYCPAVLDGLRLVAPSRLAGSANFPAGYDAELLLPRHVGLCNDYRFLVDAVDRYRAAPLRAESLPSFLLVLCTTSQEDLARQLERLRACAYPPAKVALLVLCLGTWQPRIKDCAFAVHILRCDPAAPLSQLNARLLASTADVLLFLPLLGQPSPWLLQQLAHWQQLGTDAVFAFPHQAEAGEGSPLDAFDPGARLEWFRELFGFRKVSACNLGLSLARFRKLGGFSAGLRDWTAGFRELGYRLFLDGAWFVPAPGWRVDGEKGDERYPHAVQDFTQVCATPWHRRHDGHFAVPKVSIYMPSYNNGRFIVQSVRSALHQDFEDLEVVICDDGSPDDTLQRLQQAFGDDPRVRVLATPNGGIGWASNRAVEQCRGLYIGQLDSDDLLKPGAVRKLVQVLDEQRDVVCAYSSAERIDADGNYVQNEYSFPKYAREKMLLTSITHHFRLFRRQAWARTTGFREDILNAVDYDMFLKLSELGPFHHVEEFLYQRRWHGNNTSLVNEATQTRNTTVVQNLSLRRQGLDHLWEAVALDPAQPRKISFRRKAPTKRIFYWPDYSTSNPYQKLLYNPLRTSKDELVDVLSAELHYALKCLKDNPKDGPVYFHLHWLNALVDQQPTAAAAQDAVQHFLRDLAAFHKLGGKLVWTLHNALSHDASYPEVELQLMQQLCRHADVIHLHAQASIDEIGAGIKIPPEKVVVVPHGNYIPYYPNYLTRAAARQLLQRTAHDFVLVFTGQLRPYKGVEQLIDTVAAMDAGIPVHLYIAGLATEEYAQQLQQQITASGQQQRITLINRFVDDHSLQLLYKAADLAVFPYRKILTSGSALLAMSFGTPAVVPAVGMTRELVEDGVNGYLFTADARGQGLQAVLAKAWQARCAGTLGGVGEAARVRVEGLDWKGVGELFRAAQGSV